MGWTTYAVGLPVGLDSPYPHLDQRVATRRHAGAAVPAGVRLTSDPVTAVREARDRGDVRLCGGGALASTLAGAIDQLVLEVNPVVLGAGPSLFDGRYDARRFTLARSTPFESGVVVQEYRR